MGGGWFSIAAGAWRGFFLCVGPGRPACGWERGLRPQQLSPRRLASGVPRNGNVVSKTEAVRAAWVVGNMPD